MSHKTLGVKRFNFWVAGPTPLTIAVIIEPAGDPSVGVIDKKTGVRLIPDLNTFIPYGVPFGK